MTEPKLNLDGSVDKRTTRGRPASNLTPEQVADSRVEVEQPREEQAHSRSGESRIPMGSTKKLNYPEHLLDSNYHHRWIQARDGRIETAKAAWYEHVLESGVPVQRPSGPYAMYLMRIEKGYYEEDQKLKNRKVIDTLQKEQKLEADEYIPDGRQHVLEKDDYDPLA